jgi:hypothetical protein
MLENVLDEIPGSRGGLNNINAHLLDSFRSEPEQLEDPPSLEGSPKSSIRFTETNNHDVEEFRKSHDFAAP